MQESKRSSDSWSGRNDGNTKVIFPKMSLSMGDNTKAQRIPDVGDYVAVRVS